MIHAVSVSGSVPPGNAPSLCFETLCKEAAAQASA